MVEKPKRRTRTKIYVDVVGKEKVYEYPQYKQIGTGKYPRCQGIDEGKGIAGKRTMNKCDTKLLKVVTRLEENNRFCIAFYCPNCETLYISNKSVKNVYRCNINDFNGNGMEA